VEYLFDDDMVDRKAGVRRVLGKAVKSGPILRPEMPWESADLGRASIVLDEEEGIFKIWYRSRAMEAGAPDVGGAESSPGKAFLCYGESEDGINWTRPSLGIYDFDGSRENNIVRELPPGIDTPFFSILKDPHDPDPGRRYKAIGFDDSVTSGIGGVECGTRGVCVSYSADGLTWTDPNLIMTTDDLTDCDCVLPRRDPATGKWIAFFRPRTHPKRRFIGCSESEDFDRWTYPRMLLAPEDRDDAWSEFYGLTAACLEGWRVGLLWVMHNNPEFSPMTNELVYSRDGSHYRRAMPGVSFLPLGPEGSPDSRMILPMALIGRDDRVLIYYRGTNQEHGSDRSPDGIGGVQMPPGRIEGGQRRSILGVATVEGRNLCGLRAEVDGIVETRWLCNYGRGGVEARASLEQGGWIRAEILDQYGRVIPGWDRDSCETHLSPGGRVRFHWGSEGLIGTSGQVSAEGGRMGHVVKLRFHLHRATLYGFQAGEDRATPRYV
jgi:hypothetical protein